MPNAAIHPSSQELAAFSQGRLSDAASAVIAQHLETCSACGKVLKSMPPDSFLVKVRAAKPGGSSVLPGLSPSPAISAMGMPKAALPPASQPPDLPPELANHPKYGIVRELGRGGMGVVYEAVHKVMDRPIAIKVINPSVLAHPDALPRFHSEVRTAAKLDHPNIVRALDADQVGSLHLLVMEYVEGKNLDNLVRARGCLPIRNACHYVHQAALGLQHAFEQGMVHRDIKPGNLVLTPRGRVKILDFGLALLRDTGIRTRRLTAMDSFMGTPEYVSPEQASDARNADTRSDIYSLGCTLFYLLAGRPPFQEETVVKLVLAHIEKEPPLLHHLRSDVPPELSAVVAQMLAKDPANRYQTPVAVAQALMQFAKVGGKTAGEGQWHKGIAVPPAGSTKLGGKPAADGALLPPEDVRASAKATFIGADTSKLNAPAVNASLLSAKKKTAAEVAEKPVKDLERAPAAPFENLVAGSLLRKQEKQNLPVSKTAPEWYRRWPGRPRGWPAALITAGFLALVILGGVIVRIATDKGELVVDMKDSNGQLKVTQGGKQITIIDGSTKVKLSSGTYEVELTKDSEGFQLNKNGFTLTRGGQEIVHVFREPPVADPPSQQKADANPQGPKADGFVRIFNGKDLTGWVVDSGDQNAWQAINGELVVSGTEEGDFQTQGYLLTEKDYLDFVLRFEFMQVGREDATSGIALRAKPGETASDSMPNNWQMPFHLTITLGEYGENQANTGSLWWSPNSGVQPVLRPDRLAETRKVGEWNAMEIEMRGQSLRFSVNGLDIQNVMLNKTPPAKHPAIGLSRYLGQGERIKLHLNY
ncbi:MAG TPA: protein kinase [Gemmataceae bacterium]|nr:protein kinase [Gemmataceae bacterium]